MPQERHPSGWDYQKPIATRSDFGPATRLTLAGLGVSPWILHGAITPPRRPLLPTLLSADRGAAAGPKFNRRVEDPPRLTGARGARLPVSDRRLVPARLSQSRAEEHPRCGLTGGQRGAISEIK